LPVNGQQPIWFGGGRLAPDLSLPRLRSHWTGGDLDQAQALAEWVSTGPPHRPRPRSPDGWTGAAARVNQVCDYLATVSVGEAATWAAAAHYTAGVVACLSTRLEAVPGPLAEAADALARTAQSRPGQPRHRGHHRGLAALRQVARTARTADRRRPDPWIRLLRALIELITVIADQHLASQQRHHAAYLRAIARHRLATLTRPTGAAATALEFPTAARPDLSRPHRRPAAPPPPPRPPRHRPGLN
jgi:hypothetical protein